MNSLSRKSVGILLSKHQQTHLTKNCHHIRLTRRKFFTNRKSQYDFMTNSVSMYAVQRIRLTLYNISNKFMPIIQTRSMGTGEPILDECERLRSSPRGNKKISINACGDLYDELARSKPDLYANAPRKRGIDLELEYYDSSEFLNPASKAPTVCLLHGAPGSYDDFASLINHLKSRNVRIIAPNFPDYSLTYKYSFRHSPRERTAILLEFFKALEIKQIDMLIGHSSAIYTMFELLNQQQTGPKLLIKSLGLFSTPTYNLPPQLAATPFRMFTLKLFDYSLLRPIILTLVHTFVKFQGIRNRVDKDRIENLLIAASAVGYSESEKMSEYLRLVQKFKLPTFVLLGCNDKLIPMRSFEQLKRDLGITGDNQVKHYDKNGKLTRDVEHLNKLVEVSQFESGGHYVFQRYARQVNDDVSAFINRKVIGPETTKL